MSIAIVMPQLGESVVEGVVTRLRVRAGDRVERDQPVVDVETDKAQTEVASPARARVARLLVSEGQTVPVGQPLLELEPVEEGAHAPAAPAEPKGAKPAPPTESPAPEARRRGNGHAGREAGRVSPVVRKMAEEHGLDLAGISGSGEGGRVTKKDVERALESPPAWRPTAQPPPPPATDDSSAEPVPETELQIPRAPTPPGGLPLGPGDRIVSFTRRRRLIAERMISSRRTVPDVTCVAEVDLGRVAALRARARAEAPEGAPRLTWLPYVAAAVVRALREQPLLNASVLDDAYVLHGDVNLGLAVDTEEGLIVPVIRRAGELSLVGLARAAEVLAERARRGEITADELQGGTFTLSNPGPRGNLWGTPIVVPPQAGVLRMGEVVKRPLVIEVDGGDAIAIRPTMQLALTYDHRLVDGVVGNGVLRRIKELLEAGDLPS